MENYTFFTSLCSLAVTWLWFSFCRCYLINQFDIRKGKELMYMASFLSSWKHVWPRDNITLVSYFFVKSRLPLTCIWDALYTGCIDGDEIRVYDLHHIAALWNVTHYNPYAFIRSNFNLSVNLKAYHEAAVVFLARNSVLAPIIQKYIYTWKGMT